MLLLSTYSLVGYGLHKIFDFVKKSSYDGIDLYLSRSNYDLWDKDYIKSLSDSFGVPVLSITASLKGMSEKGVDEIIEIAKTLGVQVVTFSPPHFGDKNITWFKEYLAKIKKDTNISIAVQNVESKFIFFIIPEYKNATLTEIKKITGDSSLDLGAVESSSGTDILKAQKILGNSIKNIYLSDKDGIKTGLLPGKASSGISHLPLESFFMKLKSVGYNGFFTLKVKPNELGAGKEELVLKNLEYVKNYYNKYYINFKI